MEILLLKKLYRNQVFDYFFYIVSKSGNFAFLWIVVILIVSYKNKDEKFLLYALSTMLVTSFLNEIVLKPMFGRLRPFQLLQIENKLTVQEKSYSFPSGHTSSSFAAAHILSKKNMPGVYFYAFLIALSRMYFYLHYPSDCIAGGILGLLISELMYSIFYREVK